MGHLVVAGIGTIQINPSFAPNDERWFITFIDDHTRVWWLYLLKEKSEAVTVFQIFFSMIKIQFNANNMNWQWNLLEIKIISIKELDWLFES